MIDERNTPGEGLYEGRDPDGFDNFDPEDGDDRADRPNSFLRGEGGCDPANLIR